MSIIAAYMLPHPMISIPEISSSRGELKVGKSCFALASKQIAALAPDTIVWISPHAESYADFFQIADGEIGNGSFAEVGKPDISFRMPYDKELSLEISRLSKMMDFEAGNENDHDISLDHGTMVPLYHLNKEYRNYRSVRLGVSGLSPAKHYQLGTIIAKAINNLNRKAVIIASGDLSHVVSEDSNLGFKQEGKLYDERMARIMTRANFGELISFDRNLLYAASSCGHRAFCIMAGCLDRLEVDSTWLGYDKANGTGYGFCRYLVKGNDPSRAYLDLYRSSQLYSASTKKKNADIYVKLATQAIETYISSGRSIKVPPKLPEEMEKHKAGVFVTIYQDGDIRGCIGTLKPKKGSISREIIANALAACEDSRFERLKIDDLRFISVKVDVIESMIPVLSDEDLDPKQYGLMVESDGRHAFLLPNLPGIESADEQIDAAKRKAGIPEDEEVQLHRITVKTHQ